MVGFFFFNDIVGYNWILFIYWVRKCFFNELIVWGDGDDWLRLLILWCIGFFFLKMYVIECVMVNLRVIM